MPLLGREPGTQAFRELDENPGDETFGGIAVLRLDSGLFFATAEALEERVRSVIQGSEPGLHALVLDLEGVDYIDSQGAAKLAEIQELAETDGVTLRLARVKPQVATMLGADGTLATLGAARVHGNVHRAVEAQLAEDARQAGRDLSQG
jgi:anti-anti-sigma factor